MEIDHLYEAYGTEALLVECSSGGLSPLAPSTYVDPWRWFNPPDPARVTSDLVPALTSFVTSPRA